MKRLLVSCFGLGWLPIAPGTWGSLPPTVIFVLMYYFGILDVAISVVMAVLVLVGCFVCVKFAPASIAATGREDPPEVVADEFAGQGVTFLVVPFLAVAHASITQILITAMLGFLLFRLFDIVKPWPIHKLEKLPQGWGVLADDLLAGVYAAIALVLCHKIGLAEYLVSLFFSQGSSINIGSAAVLGAIQGLTEFLPVSSSGHLVLLETFMELKPEKPEMLLFDLAIHVGTLAAIFIVFRSSIAGLFKNLISFRKYGSTPAEIYKRCPSMHLLALAIVTTLTTAVPGFLFKDYFTSARNNLTVVAVMWIITGTLLLITDSRKKTRLSLRRFGIFAAILVGLAQAAAIMPGISRSGATICAAILIGLHRKWAVEFSFLIAIPAILGASAIQLVQDFGAITSGTLPIGSVFVGFVAAALVGIWALKMLIKAARSARLKFFAIYCYILAGFVLIYLWK